MRRATCFMLAFLCLMLSGCKAPQEKTPNGSETIIESAETEQPESTISETENSEEKADETAEKETIMLNANLDDEAFVCVTDYISDIKVELKYATTDNITKTAVYDFKKVYLRYGTVKKLKKVQESLNEQGFCLKIWDGYRPVEAQFALWKAFPDARYVANPNTGYSSHTRGNTVDVTMVYCSNGEEVTMPSGFDDFSELANRDYNDCPDEAKNNALILEKVMEENGFKPYSAEWWHFSDVDSYAVEKNFTP